MSCDHELANEWARCSGKNASYITITIISCLFFLKLLTAKKQPLELKAQTLTLLNYLKFPLNMKTKALQQSSLLMDQLMTSLNNN